MGLLFGGRAFSAPRSHVSCRDVSVLWDVYVPILGNLRTGNKKTRLEQDVQRDPWTKRLSRSAHEEIAQGREGHGGQIRGNRRGNTWKYMGADR